MLNLKRKVNAFTLAETLIVASLFAVMVLWIIFWINRAFAFMNDTRLRVRASNLAREWVEMMYNIRDTNRRKHSWERDKYRLTRNENEKFRKWIVVLVESWSNGETHIIWDHYYNTDEAIECYEDIKSFFENNNCSTIRTESRSIFPWTYEYYSGWLIATWNIEDLLEWDWTEFYRIVRIYGIYKKNNDNPNDEILTDSNLEDWTPAEMRFCVKVLYRWNGWEHATELCSIMTNFLE